MVGGRDWGGPVEMLSKPLRRADDARGMVNKRLKRRRCMGLAAAAIKCEWSTGFTFKVATQAQSRDANAVLRESASGPLPIDRILIALRLNSSIRPEAYQKRPVAHEACQTRAGCARRERPAAIK